MTTITLIRHGQAQQGARDEASYDNLSALGLDQAGWLGEYISASSHDITSIVSGEMKRQRQTAQKIESALGVPVTHDQRLNEINYFALAAAMKDRHGVEYPNGRAEFLAHLPQAMQAWQDGTIQNPDEDFADYEQRVSAVLEIAEQRGGTMLVTSGGIIGMALRHILDLDTDAFAHLLLQTHNASMHRYQVEFGQRRLVTFNATPHLDAPGREAARTYI